MQNSDHNMLWIQPCVFPHVGFCMLRCFKVKSGSMSGKSWDSNWPGIMSSAGRELRFQWPVNNAGCTREQIKTQLRFAILPTECVFHYRLNPKKRSSDSDNNFRCIDFYDQFAKLMTLESIICM